MVSYIEYHNHAEFNIFFWQTFVCLIVMSQNKTRAIEDINISIALDDFEVIPLISQCKLNDIAVKSCPLFISHYSVLIELFYLSQLQSH